MKEPHIVVHVNLEPSTAETGMALEDLLDTVWRLERSYSLPGAIQRYSEQWWTLLMANTSV